MLNKLLKTTLSIMGLSTALSVYADGTDNCKVQLAVSTPPIMIDQNVAFNVSTEGGINKSITLRGGMSPQFIEKLPCSTNPILISATIYSTPSNDLKFQVAPVGQCVLRASNVVLNGSGNTISVVFPYDFTCPADPFDMNHSAK